ncbi:MAG: hypothetical protein PHW41_04170 [Eubacteriales bacterium]|nr:hypothetical protein [Eubacteriales bacterium]
MAFHYGPRPPQPLLIGQHKSDIKIKPSFDFGNPYGSGGSGASENDDDVLSNYINEMYARFAPQEADYTAKSEDEIRDSVAAWLRPNYEQAIINRQEQTRMNKANLDADAIARGMGASTYVTDVKNRQQNAEASDIATLEADYGSTLSKYVLDGVDSEQDRALEAEKFNAQQRQSAYDQAYSAALALFSQYQKRGGRSGRSGPNKTSFENCETFLSLLSGEERRVVYEGSTAQGARYRAELMASVGTSGYIRLMGKYPGSP